MREQLSKILVDNLPMLVDALASLAVGVLMLVLTRLAAWLRTKQHGEQVANALVRLGDAVVTAVANVEQEMRPHYGHATADGRVTAEEARALRDEALRRARAQLGDIAAAEIRRALGYVTDGQLQAAIEQRIEAAVHQMKPRPAVVGRDGVTLVERSNAVRGEIVR